MHCWTYRRIPPLLVVGMGLDRDIPVVIGDTAKHPVLGPYKQFFRFMALVSLKSRSGLRFGRLGIIAKDPRPDFSMNETDFFVEAARRVSALMGV